MPCKALILSYSPAAGGFTHWQSWKDKDWASKHSFEKTQLCLRKDNFFPLWLLKAAIKCMKCTKHFWIRSYLKTEGYSGATLQMHWERKYRSKATNRSCYQKWNTQQPRMKSARVVLAMVWTEVQHCRALPRPCTSPVFQVHGIKVGRDL